MTDLVFEAPSPVVVPVRGGGAFPVRRVYCVGRNFAEHAREMGHDPDREPPFFFGKPADAVTTATELPYPPKTENLHHEVELVVALGRGGADIAVMDAPAHIFGYAIGLDLTRRDLQQAARKAGRPWDMGKGFDRSAPIAPIVPVAAAGHPARGAITLDVNGERRQSGDISEMIWSVPEIVAELSRFVTLAPGDLIFTGTPAGVGPLLRGDRVSASIAGVGVLALKIV